ncbi:helix-turn-helix transcriptional regulator [Flavobacteriaceae bacterium M23B6Z8]
MVNSEEFSKRLQQIIDFYDLSASSFSDKIGVQRSSISHILSGRNKPSLDFILKTIDAFPEVPLYWLLLNKGSFPPSEIDATIEERNEAPINLFSKVDSDKIPEEAKESLSSESRDNITVPDLKDDSRTIERIVIFFKDGSFKDYHN